MTTDVLNAKGARSTPITVLARETATITITPSSFNGRAWLQRQVGGQWENNHRIDGDRVQQFTVDGADTYSVVIRDYTSGSLTVDTVQNEDILEQTRRANGDRMFWTTNEDSYLGVNSRQLSEGLLPIALRAAIFNLQALTGQDVSLLSFAVAGDGVADDTAKVIAGFQAAANAGKRLRVPRGTYLMKDTLAFTIAADFEVLCDPGAVFVAHSSFPVDKKFVMPTSTTGQNRFKWTGGKLDGRSMPARVSGAPDLMYLSSSHLDLVELDGIRFLNNNDRTGTAGDSSLFLAEGSDYKVTNCVFQGAVDSGVYISGDNAETVGRRCIITNCTFLDLGVGVISKRGFQDHVIANNIATRVNSGFVIGGIGDIGTVGRKATITGNLIKSCGRGIEARCADGTTITGNRIEDFGVDASGTPIADYAIRVSGSKYCTVATNTLIHTGAFVSHASTAGILIERRTELGVDFDPTHNLIATNVVQGCARGIVETTGANFNQIVTNQLTGLSGARIVIVGTGSTYVDHDTVGKRIRTLFGSSAAAPVAGSNVVVENSGDLIFSYLVPNANAVIIIFGSPANPNSARIAWNAATNRITLRVGATDRISIDSNGIGFNGVAPVARQTYGGPTGTATRTTFDTTTVTTAQLAERVKALIDDLRNRGDLG